MIYDLKLKKSDIAVDDIIFCSTYELDEYDFVKIENIDIDNNDIEGTINNLANNQRLIIKKLKGLEEK